jgi:LysM repeat protein
VGVEKRRMTDRWIDYSGLRPDHRTVVQNGAKGVLRYLSEPIPSTAWKRITVSEKDAILASGLDLILNWEWYEGRCLEGYGAGVHDGQAARAQALALGYPRGASIYFSHDTGARNDAAVVAYFRGAQAGLGSDYHADVYSGFDVVELILNYGLARYGWQTLAWSGGRIGRAHLYQNGNQWFGNGADENIVRSRPLGSWRDHAGGPAPETNPDPVPIAPSPVSGDLLYTVRSGDNLTSIAAEYPDPSITAASIAALNHLANPNLLGIGQVLVIRRGSGKKPGPAPAPRPAPAPVKNVYTVVSGDTLSAIAARYHTTVAQLIALNPRLRANPDFLQVGWQLVLPGASPRHAPATLSYRIVSGDTLGGIAAKHHTSVAQLMAWNSSVIKNPNQIKVGWVIRVG